MQEIQEIAAAALAEKAKQKADARIQEEALCQYYKAEQAWTRLFERAATLTLPNAEAGEIILAVADPLTARQAGPQVKRFKERASGDYKHALQHVAVVLLAAMEPEATAQEIGRAWNSANGWTRNLYDAASRAYEALHRPEPEPAPEPPMRPLPAVPETPTTAHKRLTTNELMTLILEQSPEAANWSITQWQTHTGRGRATIQGTQQWKKLRAAHALAMVDRAMQQDRQRGSNKRGMDGGRIDRRRQGRNID